MEALSRKIAVPVLLATASMALAGCKPEAAVTKPLVPIRYVQVEYIDYAPTMTLTGEIRPQVQNDLSFRVTGRVIARSAEVGARVAAGEVLARIEPAEQQTNLAAAQASVNSAEAQLRQAATAFERQKALLAQGFTTRRDYEQAEETARVAQGTLQAARAQYAVMRDQLSYTDLKAATSGVVTARYVEIGQVVQAAQAVFTVAQDGARDAVFNVHETAFAEEPRDRAFAISLVSDRAVSSSGTVREVAPTLNATTGSVIVKVGLTEPPPSMAIGAAVSGIAQLRARPAVVLPWQALTSATGKPAVWIVDPRTRAVTLRPVTVAGYEAGRVVISHGLASDELVATAGAHFLRPGQVVELAEGGKS